MRLGPAGTIASAVELLVLVASLAGCATPEGELSPSDWIAANRTVFDKVGSPVEADRKEAVARLKSLEPEQAKAIIHWVLNDPKIENQALEVGLARILADWKDPFAIPFLLQGLKAADDGLVRFAEEGLLVFGDNPHVMDSLSSLLREESLRDRQVAANVLRKMGSQQAVDVLAGRMKAELDAEVRAQMLMAVIDSRHPRRLDFLVDALSDADLAIRELAWGALKRQRNLPDVGYSPTGSEVERARAVGALRVWLKVERPKAPATRRGQ